MEDSLPFPDLDTDTTTSFAQLWNDTITEVDFGDMGEFFQQMEGNVRNVSNDHSYSQHSGQSEQDTETTGMEGQQDRVTSSMTSGPSATSSDVPSTTVYPGPFSFQVAFPPQTLKPKSKKLAWTWSQPCKMLYADFNKICPFNFKTVRPPPAGCLIRAMPVYLKHEHIGLPVKRCPTHRENDFNNADPPAHFLHCRGKAVEYREDPTTGRHSVIIPYEHPQAGTEWSTILYKFMCRSTCLNRRSMAVVFTLEDSSGGVLGRQAVKIKICSCPGRDREQDEEALLPQPTPGSKKRLMTDSKTSQKKRKKTSVSGGGGANDGEVFTVNWQIRGRKNYETLLRVKEALEVQHRCETDPQVAALLRSEDEQTDQQQPRPPTEPTPTDQTANQSTAVTRPSNQSTAVTRPSNQSTAVTRPSNQSTSVARPASQGSVRYTLRRTVSKPKTWE
ncbi:cellular tumor antigen p53-like [Branchiostoma lanceolatum]|uniref:cellular tumor antigen p53-like n=1 Tax=Branchiostoma lanceolatum TaxID=7740 RepID=UPI003455E238